MCPRWFSLVLYVRFCQTCGNFSVYHGMAEQSSPAEGTVDSKISNVCLHRGEEKAGLLDQGNTSPQSVTDGASRKRRRVRTTPTPPRSSEQGNQSPPVAVLATSRDGGGENPATIQERKNEDGKWTEVKARRRRRVRVCQKKAAQLTDGDLRMANSQNLSPFFGVLVRGWERSNTEQAVSEWFHSVQLCSLWPTVPQRSTSSSSSGEIWHYSVCNS